jgi:hypothetical protein
MAAQDAPAPLGVADLNVAEQFVLWALRTRLEGDAKRGHLEHGFCLAHDPPGGGAALAAFESWFEVLARQCWRDLYLHRASCPCLSDDERAMLDLVASAQLDDERRLHRAARGLVQPQAIESLQQVSRIFAAALRELGLRLSGRPLLAWRNARAMLHELMRR